MSAFEEPELADRSRLCYEPDWVTVATFRDLGEAEMARVTLDAEGIRCYLADAEVIRLDWTLSMALGGIKLRVPAAERERALGRLHRTSSAQVLRLVDDRGEEDTARCAACGAALATPPGDGLRRCLAALRRGWSLMFRPRAPRCTACGGRTR